MSTNATLIEKYPLERRKILKKTVQWIYSIVAFLFIFFLFAIFSMTYMLLLLLIAFLACIVFLFVPIYIYQTFYFKNYFYDLTEEGLIIKKGVFSTKKSIVPLDKIQDVYLDQDIFDKIFGLWDLHISSATETSGFEAHIDGVNEINGREMRRLLLGETLHIEKETVTETYLPDKVGLIPMAISSFVLVFFLCLALPFLIILSIPILLVLLALNFLEFKSIRYELRNDGVFIKRGFLSPKESLVLYRNIQDIEETQNIIEIVLGIKTLSVKTMTGQSAVYSKLQYLPQDTAPTIREKVLKLSQKISEVEISVEEEKDKFAMKKGIDYEPKLEEISPYKNHFIKAAIYSYIIYLGPVFVLAVLLCVSLGMLASSPSFLWALFVLVVSFIILVLLVANAAILSFTYTYSLLPNSVVIKHGLLNVIKKQINYDRIQDVVVRISFSQYLAKLASLKIDTGSREVYKSEYGQKSSALSSFSTLAESLPDLEFAAAANLRKRILDFMGVSVKGLWENPLVSQFPLEKIKPVKKTLWWVIYFFILSVLIFIIVSYFKLSSLLFFVLMIFLAALIIKYLYEREYYKRYFYDMNDDVLLIKKGVFGTTEIILPVSKIQDVFIDQDILDRVFKMRDLYVSTVTNRSILNAHIDGVSPEKAEKMALLLLEKIKNKRKKQKGE